MTASQAPAVLGNPYGEFLAEQEEILRLKWLVSEREGEDIGFEVALNQWATSHRAKWRRMRNEQQRQEP